MDDAYREGPDVALLTGIQALVRSTLEQRRRDAAAGLDTGLFVSGYQGSPLAGLDREFARAAAHLDPLGIVVRPGVNEELAATAVGGTQLLGELEHRRHEGVAGVWYGKSPGLDRATDAIRHANLSGTAPLGGAVAWIGDDPSSKSSTVPSSCEPTCRSLLMPLLAPGTVPELLSFALHAVALSRHAGTWAGLKIVADVADATATVDLAAARAGIPTFPVRTAGHPPVLLPPTNLDAEQDLMGERLDRAREYARAAGLNRVVHAPPRARTAILAAGSAFSSVLRALDDLGLDAGALDTLGLRLVRLGMPWPVDRAELRELLAGVETVLVVEDKLAFLEGLVKEALYRCPDAPLVLGKEDADGRELLSPRSSLGADEIAVALARLLPAEQLGDRATAHLARLERAPSGLPPLPARTPYFCSGCPHNASTRAQPDRLVGVGIGCHVMVAIDDATSDRRGQLLGMPQMGGEGAQWLGLAPFTEDTHFTQNLGDGTFHHSGSLAIRAAVAAGVNMTYRLLYNDAVAMTGGQRAEGRLDVPDLTRWLALEGVRKTVITTPEPEDYRGVALAPGTTVRHRDELQAVARELEAVPGVTVLLHDDRCATEERRMRKRGELPTPAERVVINERVCEGCGDCGEQSTCLSVQPIETEFGRKTTIDQSSCNHDRSCLKGDCPSFLLVTPGKGVKAPTPPPLPVALTEPSRRVGDEALIRMAGVGGTGVVTVSQVLQMAAHLEGRHAAGLEQIGLAQKGGPVLSDLRFSREPISGQLRASGGAADVLLGFDLLGAAAPPTLAVSEPGRTVAILAASPTPTAQMVTDPSAPAAQEARALRRVRAATDGEAALVLDPAALCGRLFGNTLAANMLLVGAAFQHGCLPLGAEAIERAIELNGTAVEATLAAFRWGRAAVMDPDGVAAALAPPPTPVAAADPRAEALLAGLALHGELGRRVRLRVGELVAYQDVRYARRYLDAVERVAAREREATGGTAVAEAFATGLFKLMAYKDEYEVARLHLDPGGRARVAAEFGADAKVELMLHPPFLRSLGLERKLRLGRGALPAMRGLRAARRLRGTPLDPFGRAAVRRLERQLIGEYEALVEQALTRLTPASSAQVVALAALPDVVRGYEDIKLANVERFRARASELLSELEGA